MMLEWVLAAIVILYCVFVLYLWLGWERIGINSNDEFQPSVAVIVPVRNEEKNIAQLLSDLLQQTYKGKWEIIVVNDHSEDNTVISVNNLSKGSINLKVLELEQGEGKKAALVLGIESTDSEIILTTDGDCRVGKRWIEAMVKAFQKDIHMVSGPVGFVHQIGLFHHMQVIEFASLIGSGAALIGWGKPIMANGANLAFRKSSFEKVQGYSGATTASGDDVFLLHKIAHRYPNPIAFAKQADAIVQTLALSNWKAFWLQRKRWASKWKAYSDLLTKGIAVLVFILSLGLGILPVLVAFGIVDIFTWLNLLIAKSFFDYFFLISVVRFSGSNMSLTAFFLLQLLHPYYVVLTALFSFGKTYTWKERKVR